MKKIISLIILFFVTITSQSHAIDSVTAFTVSITDSKPNKYPNLNVENEVLRYTRCYAHLVRAVVPKNDIRLPLIKLKAINGSEACLNLLESAKLNDEGIIKKEANGSFNKESKSIIKTMNDFHRSWFPTYDYISAVPMGECFSQANYSLYNNGEMALHITNALFSKNIPYSNIVKNSKSFEAIRDDKSNGSMSITVPASQSQQAPNNVSFIPRYLTTGEIVGIKNLEPESFPNSIDFRSSFGGGILGSVPFLILNSGRNNFETIDGGTRQYRRWSKAVFSSLFCRDIPVVRSADAVSKVQSSSALPFRKGISCMQCHSSIDPLAQIQRNKTIRYTNGCNPGSMSYVQNINISHSQETLEQVDADNDYFRRPPKGKFYFRTHDGKLLNKEVMGLDGMGEYMATVDDLYICAAKRYFQFFTGIDVPMFDSGDFSAPKLSDKQSTYRKIVVEMGKDLKNNQNLEILIHKIISSGAYINPGIGED